MSGFNNTHLDSLEQRFLIMKASYPMLTDIFQYSLKALNIDGSSNLSSIIKSGYNLINVLEQDDALRKKLNTRPHYHNIDHASEVVLAVTMLLEKEPDHDLNNWSMLTQEEKGLILCAALGHDLYHPGGKNRIDCEFEKNSAKEVANIMRLEKVSEHHIDWVSQLIMATNFEDVASLHRQYNDNLAQRSKLLQAKILLTEADIFASILPKHGEDLTHKLSKEFEEAGVAHANQLLLKQARQDFLNSISFSSLCAQKLGLI